MGPATWNEVEPGDVAIAEHGSTVVSGVIIDVTEDTIVFQSIAPLPREEWSCMLRVPQSKDVFEDER